MCQALHQSLGTRWFWPHRVYILAGETRKGKQECMQGKMVPSGGSAMNKNRAETEPARGGQTRYKQRGRSWVPTSTNSITWEPLRNADSRAESQGSESETLGEPSKSF